MKSNLSSVTETVSNHFPEIETIWFYSHIEAPTK